MLPRLLKRQKLVGGKLAFSITKPIGPAEPTLTFVRAVWRAGNVIWSRSILAPLLPLTLSAQLQCSNMCPRLLERQKLIPRTYAYAITKPIGPADPTLAC